LIELQSPFADEQGVIRLLEDRNMTQDALLNSVFSGTYDRPFVIDDGLTRSLYFSLKYVQSTMYTRDPIRLEFAYTQKMMSFMLFQHETRNILMLGLGGGSLAKFCYSHLQECQIRVVEIDPYVIGFRDQFHIPEDNERFSVIHDDATHYIGNCPIQPDVIMMDAFDRHGFSASIDDQRFYRKARSVLSPNGILVANLAGSQTERLTHLNWIREAFEDHLLILQIEDDGNHVVVAFRDRMYEPEWRQIEKQAKQLQNRFCMNFPRMAQKLERSKKLGYVERIINTRGAPLPGLNEAPISSESSAQKAAYGEFRADSI